MSIMQVVEYICAVYFILPTRYVRLLWKSKRNVSRIRRANRSKVPQRRLLIRPRESDNRERKKVHLISAFNSLDIASSRGGLTTVLSRVGSRSRADEGGRKTARSINRGKSVAEIAIATSGRRSLSLKPRQQTCGLSNLSFARDRA